MTFSRKIILLAAVALAISLGTACSSFDATPAVNHQTAEPTATSKATNSTLPPENGAANNAAATQPHPWKQTLQDDQRWCQAWALDNLKPYVYAEFAKLDPANMDDLDQTAWRARLNGNANYSYFSGSLPTYDYDSGAPKSTDWENRVGNCWMYWSEPLRKTNAERPHTISSFSNRHQPNVSSADRVHPGPIPTTFSMGSMSLGPTLGCLRWFRHKFSPASLYPCGSGAVTTTSMMSFNIRWLANSSFEIF